MSNVLGYYYNPTYSNVIILPVDTQCCQISLSGSRLRFFIAMQVSTLKPHQQVVEHYLLTRYGSQNKNPDFVTNPRLSFSR